MTIKTSWEYLKGDVLRKKSYPFFLQHASSLDVVVGNNNKNKALQYECIVLLSKYLEKVMNLWRNSWYISIRIYNYSDSYVNIRIVLFEFSALKITS